MRIEISYGVEAAVTDLTRELDDLVRRHRTLQSREPRVTPEEEERSLRLAEEGRRLLRREALPLLRSFHSALRQRGFHAVLRDDLGEPFPTLELAVVAPPSSRRGRCRARGSFLIRCDGSLRCIAILAAVWGRRGERDTLDRLSWTAFDGREVEKRVLTFLDRLLTEC